MPTKLEIDNAIRRLTRNWSRWPQAARDDLVLLIADRKQLLDAAKEAESDRARLADHWLILRRARMLREATEAWDKAQKKSSEAGERAWAEVEHAKAKLMDAATGGK